MPTPNSAKDLTPKSTTAARLAVLNGPATTAEHARKNRKKRTHDDASDLETCTPPTSTQNLAQPMILPEPITTRRIPKNQPNIYAHSDPDSTPAPSPTTPLGDRVSPSPPSSPSPIRATTNNTQQAPDPFTPTEDITMADTPKPQPKKLPTLALFTNRHPLTSSHSEGEIPITRASLPHHSQPSSLKARLQAAAERVITNPSTKGSLRNPLDKYTKAIMPHVQDAHPTSAMDYLDLDLAGEWENHPGGKLLAIPFDTEVHDIESHSSIRSRLFAAVADITQSDHVSVSAPKQSTDAIKARRPPSSFLIYNLTDDHCSLLTKRRIWSSTAITFRVIALQPTCPDFLFTIKGFSTLTIDDIASAVSTVWHDEETTNAIKNTADSFVLEDREDVLKAMSAFLDSLKVTRLDTRQRGESLVPRFNIYAQGALIQNDDLWVLLRDFLANRVYATPLQGTGTTETAPNNCGICHGVDHPRGLCPFPELEGWHGPKRNVNQRGRNGRQFDLNLAPRRYL